MPDNNLNELILTELREFRADVVAWQQQMGERVSSLEIQVKTGVTGNGQPSRLQVAEDAIDGLLRWKWKIMGASVVVSALITCVGWLITQFWK